MYIEDEARGIVLAAEKYDDILPMNLGSGQEVTIRDLITTIARLMNYEGTISWDTTKPNGQPRRCVSNKRAEKLIGFKPAMELKEGLRKTITWFTRYMRTVDN